MKTFQTIKEAVTQLLTEIPDSETFSVFVITRKIREKINDRTWSISELTSDMIPVFDYNTGATTANFTQVLKHDAVKEIFKDFVADYDTQFNGAYTEYTKKVAPVADPFAVLPSDPYPVASIPVVAAPIPATVSTPVQTAPVLPVLDGKAYAIGRFNEKRQEAKNNISLTVDGTLFVTSSGKSNWKRKSDAVNALNKVLYGSRYGAESRLNQKFDSYSDFKNFKKKTNKELIGCGTLVINQG